MKKIFIFFCTAALQRIMGALKILKNIQDFFNFTCF